MSYVLDLTGRRVLITGAASGIGAAIAEAMAAAGATVTASDRDGEAAAALADRLGARAVTLDVSDIEGIADAVERNGPFDILVNNAGMHQQAFFTQTASQEWDALLAVNLQAVLAASHAVLPSMQSSGWGRIITIASEAGRQGSKGGAVYAAAKAGTIGFMKSLARENARFGITANAICPGPIRTPMLDAAVAATDGRMLATMTGQTLLQRLGEPHEVAGLAVFLASERASYITGEAIGVSGGMGV